MTDTQPQRGARFEHARLLDLTWTPAPGERWATDAPRARMVVTAVRSGRVYYRYAGSVDGDAGNGFVVDADRLAEVVGRWL